LDRHAVQGRGAAASADLLSAGSPNDVPPQLFGLDDIDANQIAPGCGVVVLQQHSTTIIHRNADQLVEARTSDQFKSLNGNRNVCFRDFESQQVLVLQIVQSGDCFPTQPQRVFNQQ